MRINTKPEVVHQRTHGGAIASTGLTPTQQLRRVVMCNMLWENTFYESGVESAARIRTLVQAVPFEDAAEIAIEAREEMKLRHVPLLITRELIRKGGGRKVGDLIARVIQRPDELGELVAMYWASGGSQQPLTAQMKVGLARALKKFSGYQLAKWNKDGAVKLRDVLFLSHAKPANEEQAKLFKQLAEGTLPIPDTWESALSGGADKKATFERLMREKKLGAMALLRNLRGMLEAKVDEGLIRDALLSMNVERVLPFRFISAAKYAPRLENALEQAMLKCLTGYQRLPGKTVLVLDTSGSMTAAISAKSELTRLQVASALAILAREMCENVVIYATAGSDATRQHATMLVPSRRGFALSDYVTSVDVRRTIGGGGIFLVQCMEHIQALEGEADRVIVLTDEQDCDRKLRPDQANAFGKRNYLINVAANKNGIGYKRFVHIDGWSEHVLEFIRQFEEAELHA